MNNNLNNVILLLLVIVSVIVQQEVLSIQCGKYETNMGATFDLTELTRTAEQPPYIVEDGDIPCTKQVEKNYTYMFNICGSIQSGMPQSCRSVKGSSAANALQIDKRETSDPSDDWCYITGFYTDSMTKISLIDYEDPSKGLTITSFGDYCKDSKQRQFTIDMPCANKLNPIPTHAYETAHCSYTVTMPSIYGCPLECPVANRQLCGGNGHCAYDYDKGAARCYCNHGFSGASCITTGNDNNSNYSPTLTGLIITLFIIILALVASIIYMYRQVSAYKDDMAHYQVLRGDMDDETVSLNMSNRSATV